MSDTFVRDIAWVAGLLEGEGSFGTTSSAKDLLRISCKSTDYDVMKRLQDVTGMGTLNGPYMPSRGNLGVKPYWDWHLNKQEQVAGLMMTILPLMGERRSEKIRECLAIWRSRPIRTTCRNGLHPKPSGRRCVECAAASSKRTAATAKNKAYHHEYYLRAKAARA